MALNALSTNIMLPGLPQIGADLGVQDENGPQLVISAYLFGMAVALLPYGPLSDRFGRRKPMLLGLGIYAIASPAAVFVSTFEALLFLRFVQGLGGAGARVISFSIMRDRFHRSALAVTMSLVMMVFMAVPVLAPLVV